MCNSFAEKFKIFKILQKRGVYNNIIYKLAVVVIVFVESVNKYLKCPYCLQKTHVDKLLIRKNVIDRINRENRRFCSFFRQKMLLTDFHQHFSEKTTKFCG